MPKMGTEVEVQVIKKLELSEIRENSLSHFWLHIVNNAIGEPIRIPIMVAKGKAEGPVLGLTAAIHGNELNGIQVIQKLFEELDVSKLKGTIIGVLVSNVPGLLIKQRYFNDHVDLNRIAPGNMNGNDSSVYIYRFIDRIVKNFTHHVDLHTASTGRINSYYVRADMENEEIARMAKLQNGQIILKKDAGDKTLRGAAQNMGIKSVTIELKDPHRFQSGVVEESLIGIRNLIYDLKMLEGEIVCPVKKTILCERSNWMFTDEGGILHVFPDVTTFVKKGELVAEVRTIFGEVKKQFFAPKDAIVIGRSVDPINQTGGRIVHLGYKPQEIDCLV